MFRGKVILCRCGSIDGLENPVLHVSGQQLAYSHLLSGRHRPAPGNIPLQIKFIGGIEEHPSTRARKRLGGIRSMGSNPLAGAGDPGQSPLATHHQDGRGTPICPAV